MERAYRVGVRPGRSEKGGKMLPPGHKAARWERTRLKAKKPPVREAVCFGVRYRARTDDTQNHNLVLYQLN